MSCNPTYQELSEVAVHWSHLHSLITPLSSATAAYPFLSDASSNKATQPLPSVCTFSLRFHPGRISGVEPK
jgi:hypothetical protein